MAKPRVFVSSTYYDLRHIRSGMETFIESFGYDPVLFESGDIPFHHDMTLAEACYSEVRNCHIFVLIIGGRYGSADDEKVKQQAPEELQKMYEAYNSVTRKEYETAREKDIPIFIFVDKNVKAELETYKANKKNSTIKYAHVDSVNIFKLLDDILLQKRNNYVREFDKFEDITSWLREQWAGIFADLLSRRRDDVTLRDMSARILELNQITSSLKEYTQSILIKVDPQESKPIIDREQSKQLSAKIKRFSKEPMISYIINESIRRDDRTVDGLKLYRSMESTTTISDFAKKAELSKDLEHELCEYSKAREDFGLLKRDYFDDYSAVEDGKTDEKRI